MPCACAVPRRERRGVLQGGLVGKGSAFAVSVLLSLLAPATRLAAQGGGGGGTIRGHVADSAGAALARVAVSIDAIGARTTTDVLVNGWRQHQTALVNNFTYGMGAGSSGVDLNTIPQSAIDRMEVLRDGASAQYGSDAIAGVVNLVMKEGPFTPYLNVDAGRYTPRDYPDDGTTVDVNSGWGVGLGRGSLGLFGEFLDRQPTNRAWADPGDNSVTSQFDSVNSKGQVVLKRNPVPQPSSHWGDGLEKDILTFANFRMPLNETRTSEVYAFGGYSFRLGTGNAYRRYGNNSRNWPDIYPLGFLPEFSPHVT